MALISKNSFRPPAVHASSLLFICAWLPALLFKGPQIEFFAITQIILMLWLGWIALQSYDTGLMVPKTGLTLCVTLFWLWLAVSLAWSEVPSTSEFNFWWVGSLALVFWLYTLTPDRDALWSHAAAIILVLGLVLALMGIYQVLVLGQVAQSVFETRNTQAALLNLIVLPATAYFLMLMLDKASPRYHVIGLGIVLYILFFGLFMSASRGATLSLMIGMALLVSLTVGYASKRAIGIVLALMLAGFLSSVIFHGELTERLPYLMQDSARLVIWKSSLNLLKVAPWRGIGLGIFYLAYPPYRSPLDTSGGFFVHNDYLQMWIETGLPGLLLLLAVLASGLWLLVRAWRATNMSPGTRIEIAGLFCGLLAVAAHSVVDFNLYILSIMMVSGLVLGRFHQLAVSVLEPPVWRLRISRVIGQSLYPAIVILLLMLPVLYFVALGLANSYYVKALDLAQQGELSQADASLSTAQRLTPGDDRMPIAHADLYRHAIALLAPDAGNDRKNLYLQALKYLDAAQQANPLRGLTDVIRARLYLENPALAGDRWQALAVGSLQHALTLNPRLFLGRLDYANLLLQQGNKMLALQTLETGAQYDYPEIPDLIPFYSLTAQLEHQAGQDAQAKAVEAKIELIKKQNQASYSLRGY
ncbi:MAG: O-antigen ligase family protein [Sulfuricaulis sp.]